MVNPIEAHRRKQHKKQVKKNKEARIKERDEKVKESKTVGEVKTEIKEFEKRHKHQLDQHAIKSKLDRLKKELKLVQEADELRQQQQAAQPPKNQYANQNALNRNFVKLDRPEMSVYYDKMYNPYGAPPPGKPMLFHKYGGGVTMNIQQAIVPGEQPFPQTSAGNGMMMGNPPPNNNSVLQATPLQPSPRSYSRPQHHNQHQQLPQAQQQKQHKTKPQSPPPLPPPPPPSPPPKEEEEEEDSTAPKISKDDIPNLPAPSEAVRRSQKTRRRGMRNGGDELTADIWASNEEVVYEKIVHQVDLENATATLQADEQELWHYQDATGNIQGPFPTEHMASWYDLGYFPPSTKVKKTGKHADFVTLGTLGKHVFQNPAGDIAKITKHKKKNSAAAAVAATKANKKQQQKEQEDSEIQARIAALKQHSQKQQQQNDTNNDRPMDEGEQQQQQQQQCETPDQNYDSSIQDRIEAMRQAMNPSQSSVDKEEEGKYDNAVDGSIQDSRAALPESNLQQQQQEKAITEENETLADPAVQDRIAALKQQAREIDDVMAPPMSDDEDEVDEAQADAAATATLDSEMNRQEEKIASNFIVETVKEEEQEEVGPIITSYYPAVENTEKKDDGPIIASYPTIEPLQKKEDGPVIASYPGVEAALQMDNGPVGAPYPSADNAKEGEDEVVEYPAVAPYPVDGERNCELVNGYAAYPEVVPHSSDNDDVSYYPAVGAYPTDEIMVADGDSAAYPVTEAYPVTDEYPIDDTYPTAFSSTDEGPPPTYPVMVNGDYAGTSTTSSATAKEQEGQQRPPPKKKYKADKSVVAFLPTHLQKKRRAGK